MSNKHIEHSKIETTNTKKSRKLKLFPTFPLFIAKRYLLSKKSTNAINIVSFISIIGVAVATMALVIVLSVFNGFHDLVASLFTNFDPQIEITPVRGKAAPTDDPLLTKIKQLPQVEVATECVEDNALADINNRQEMVVIKGVDNNFQQLTYIDDILYGEGSYQLKAGNLQYGIPGIRLSQMLGLGTRWDGFMKIYAPQREGQLDMTNPESGFVVDSIISPGVVFAVKQSKYDAKYILTSISFARNLFGMQGMLTSLELRLKNGNNLDRVKQKIKEIAAGKYNVKDRFEQQEDTYRIMRIEKFIAYIFLTFILLVASFNIIGSLSMLIIDKKNDVNTLRNLGANNKQISQIFLFEGRLISLIGAIIGILLGLLLCWIQQQYGIVRLGGSDGSFIIDAYPVSVHYSDVLWILITVIIVGWCAVWYPVRNFTRKVL